MKLISFLKRSDTILAVFVIAITVMLLVPLPTPTLDFLLAFNLSFSILLLLIGLYVNSSQALLVFPSILLLSTLFRLSLNVASSRLILSQGDAGRVIEAFGTFLIRGELAVGAIVFILITIVNFIVIARGSGRVSEVAARFVLEAMPGKQMAIDSELRSGVIDVVQAQHKREDLRKETQLYASMDGAMKFVQGDAIAGLFIIVVNIIGGMYMGLQNGMSLGDALQTYTMLTVGDGLVTQIPAIMIAVCSGIVVTRVSSGEGATLGGDIAKQIFSNPIVLFWAALLVLIMAALPGIPVWPFLAVASIFALTAFILNRRVQVAGAQITNLRTSSASGTLMLSNNNDQSVYKNLPEKVIRIKLSTNLWSNYQQSKDYYSKSWQALRSDFYQKVGISLPAIDVQGGSEGLDFSVTLSGNKIISGTLPNKFLVVECLPTSAEFWGLVAEDVITHPLSGGQVVLVAEHYREHLSNIGLSYFEIIDFLFLKIAAHLNQNPELIFSALDVHAFLRDFEQSYPGVLNEILDRRFLSVPRLTEIFQTLLKEGLSIREPVRIIEGLASYAATVGVNLVKDDEFAIDDIITYLRKSLMKLQLADLTQGEKALRVVLLSEQLENMIFEVRRDAQSQSNFAFSSELILKFKAVLKNALSVNLERGLTPVFLYVRPELRTRVVALLRQVQFNLVVINGEELDRNIVIKPVSILDANFV